MSEQNDDETRIRGRKRLRGLANHLIAYFAVMIVLVPVNVMTTPHLPWFVVPLVGWGAILALHTAYAMGLMDRWFD